MKYEIRFLPLASKDLSNIVSYIADELKAPKAAMDLIYNILMKIKIIIV